ncbi:ATP-binding protein [Flavobacterium sp. 3HN19-14]|uniref:ATP-binding protein n=1 Tax=Flavobacterium sp. 3HN19-14 TaxID=3448133 RepID=UPI003EDFD870
MKFSTPLFLFLFCISSIAAQVKPVEIDDDQYGLSLFNGWRLSKSDNPAFADANYDDSAWDAIAPYKSFSELPELNNVKTGWIRIHFKTSAKIGDKTFVLTTMQNAASEIYYDGKLLRRYGKLSNNPAEVNPAPVNDSGDEILITHSKEHVIAIRFSPWRDPLKISKGDYFYVLMLDRVPQYLQQQINGVEYYFSATIYISVFSLLFLLHTSFFRYDRAQRANLFFALYAFFSTIGFAGFMLVRRTNSAEIVIYFTDVATCFSVLAGVWVTIALAELFNFSFKKMRIVLWCLYAIFVAAMFFKIISYPILISNFILGIIQLWLIIRAMIAKKRGVVFIVTGFAFSLAAAAVFASGFITGAPIPLLISRLNEWVLVLAPAIGISLFLAREFALDSKLLREKLLQVEMLSAKNLAQEQERQQILARQNDELETQVAQRTSELRQSIDNLKATQAQLIQAEKMASLGELTAGIAHEIQNPLNFVNNFSDISNELIDEMNEELDKGDIGEAKAIATDIKQNLEKINHHGKRADAIVKGMLQHSRASSGQKEMTDVNALADEYLRLAYHGLRAKDKSFNAELVTNFDENLPKIPMIPQDIGRVLLNLFVNGFYATQKRKESDPGFKPVMEVTTSVKENTIEISVKDNGTGIPQQLIDKIFQPFFTTKPTGEGTGLGLSLAYDIVKAHGGTIKLQSEAGKGTTFTIQLAIKTQS